jgi:predicted outer membrane repeat protein
LYTNFRDGGGSGDNYGGAIYVYEADVDVSNSTFTGNTAGDEYGGAIHNDDHTSLTGDTFRQNAADYGAAVYNDYDLTAQGSQLENNSAGEEGGGIYDDNNPVRVALHHTEVVGNTPNNLENNSSALACGV